MFLFSLRSLTGADWHQSFHFFFKSRPLSSPWSSAQYSVVARVRCCVPMHPEQRGSGLFVGESSVSRKLKILSRPGRRGRARSRSMNTSAFPSVSQRAYRDPRRDRSSIPALPIEFRSPVESSAICIPGMIARYRRLRARARALPANFLSRDPDIEAGTREKKVKRWALTDTCVAHLRERYKLSHACVRVKESEKWASARNRSEIEKQTKCNERANDSISSCTKCAFLIFENCSYAWKK